MLSHLSILKDSELLYERGIYPQSTYIFKHALIQVVAYDSLLVKRKQELHRRIGQAMEELYADRLAEQYEALAYHFAKGQEWAKAFEYLGKAAEKAAHTFANHEAVALYDQALEAAGHLGDAADIQTLMAIHRAKMNLYFVLSDYEKSRAEGEHLLTLARRIGDRMNESLALVTMGKASHYAHDLEQALTYSNQAIEVAGAADAKATLAGAHYTIGAVHGCKGQLDLEHALAHNQRAVAGARKRGDPETIANSELNLGDNLLAQGDHRLAEEIFDRVSHLVADPATSEYMRWRYSTHLFASLGELWLSRGDPAKAGEFVEQSLKIANRTNSRKYLVQVQRLKGEVALLNKKWDDAGDALQKALTIARAIGNPTQLWKTYLALGRLHTEAKQQEMAEQAFDAAREVINKIMENLQDPKLSTSLKNHPLIRQIFDRSSRDQHFT